MTWPATREELRAAGWAHLRDGWCARCPARVEWWATKNGKRAPLVEVDGGKLQSHFADCPAAAAFRRAK